MRKNVFHLSGLFIALMLCVLFQGCLKDSARNVRTYTFYVPVYKTMGEVLAGIKTNLPEKVVAPGKIYVYGHYILINDIDRGIHVIDNTDPVAPKAIGFIRIPGNRDIAVSGSTLYADLYRNLVSLDIKDLKNVVVKKVIRDIFPNRKNDNFPTTDSTKVIADWIRHDTTVTTQFDLSKIYNGVAYMNYMAATPSAMTTSVAPNGIAGSTSRFTILNDRLYAVAEGAGDLTILNITDAGDPKVNNIVNIGWNIETIYPFNNHLFIGSQTGMYVYDVTDPDNPVSKGQFTHLRSCDPVVADGQYAYVTLRSGNACAGSLNELDVLLMNEADHLNPELVNVYHMKSPYGLAKDGDILFVCDEKEGISLFNVKDPLHLSLIKKITHIQARDIIATGGLAIITAEDGLYEYYYTPSGSTLFASKIVMGQ